MTTNGKYPVRTLLLVRHAQTKWNSEGRFQGHLDSPVTEEGVAQVEAVARRLSTAEIDAVYTSDLGRSILTADRIARAAHAPVKVDVRLRERNHGLFEGLTRDIARSLHPEWVEQSRLNHDPDFAVPQAESKRAILLRMLPAMVEAMESPGKGSIVVVGHGGVINVFLNHAAGQSLAARRNVVPNCSVSVIEYSFGTWRPLTIGEADHLSVLARQGEPVRIPTSVRASAPLRSDAVCMNPACSCSPSPDVRWPDGPTAVAE